MTSTRAARKRIKTRAMSAKLRLWATTILLLLSSLTASAVALAGDLDRIVVFNIEAQTLDRALLQFGAQAHVQIMFAWDSATARLRTRELKGNYTGREALSELLRGTPLRFVAHQRTVEILPKIAPSTPARAERREKAIAEEIPADPPVARAKPKKLQLQEVVVTGSRLHTTSDEIPQEIRIYDSAQIDQSGQNSIADFLSTLPSVSVTPSSTATGYTATVALRGLPVGTTLVLVNGRRLESSGLANNLGGGSYFDLNDIPLAAVQRVEVDQSGSSAVYGSDAIAGVVNIILRQDFDGLAVDAKYGSAKDDDTIRTDAAFGKQWDRGGFSLIATYGTDGGLLNSERLLSSSNDYSSYGGPDNNYPTCNPANVFSLDGTPLPGAPPGSGATFATVTGSVESGRPPLSQFTYGTLNTCSLIAGRSLMPSARRGGLLAQGNLQLTSNVALFSEIIYSHEREIAGTAYQALTGFSTFQEFTASASNPYNPFGVPVGIGESLPDAAGTLILNTDFFRPLVGLKGEIQNSWRWEISVWQSSDWTQGLEPNAITNYGAIQSALNSSDPSTAANPFVRGPIAPAALLETFFSPGNIKLMGRDRSAEAFITGPVLQTPAGDVQLVLGGAYDRNTLYYNEINDGVDPPNTMVNYDNSHRAVFVEGRIPLIPHRLALGRRSLLDITVAGRHDEYTQGGGATTGQFGVTLMPTDSIRARATYAESFQAPSLPNLYSPQTEGQAVVVDPTSGAPSLVQIISGGNAGLRPITGSSHTVGIVYASKAILGLRLSATQWQVLDNNNIQAVPPQTMADYPALFPGRVIRDSSGSLAELIDTLTNFGSLDVAGIDYEGSYHHGLARGVFEVDLEGTETYRYNQALVPGSPAMQAVSVAEDDGNWAPRWKGIVGAGWSDAWISGRIDGRYTGPYQDYDSTRRIGNFWMVDANARWQLGKVLGLKEESRREAYLEVGATNLFNRSPQFSNYIFDFYGYDAAQASIVGRTLYLEAGVHW